MEYDDDSDSRDSRDERRASKEEKREEKVDEKKKPSHSFGKKGLFKKIFAIKEHSSKDSVRRGTLFLFFPFFSHVVFLMSFLLSASQDGSHRRMTFGSYDEDSIGGKGNFCETFLVCFSLNVSLARHTNPIGIQSGMGVITTGTANDVAGGTTTGGGGGGAIGEAVGFGFPNSRHRRDSASSVLYFSLFLSLSLSLSLYLFFLCSIINFKS